MGEQNPADEPQVQVRRRRGWAEPFLAQAASGSPWPNAITPLSAVARSRPAAGAECRGPRRTLGTHRLPVPRDFRLNSHHDGSVGKAIGDLLGLQHPVNAKRPHRRQLHVEGGKRRSERYARYARCPSFECPCRRLPRPRVAAVARRPRGWYPSFSLRRKSRQAERGPGTGGAGDRRQ